MGGDSRAVFTMLSLICLISTWWLCNFKHTLVSGMDSSASVIRPLSVFGPLVGRLQASVLLIDLIVADPSIM